MDCRKMSIGLKYLFGLICVIFISISTVFAEKYEPLRVGVIAPLSGSGAGVGVATRNGFELAEGDTGGSWRLQILYEDDAYDPKKTVGAFQKLQLNSGVDVVISIASTPSNAVAPLAERAGIPLLAWASDRAVNANRSFVIRTYPSGESEGHYLADEALRRGYRQVYAVHSVNDYAASVSRGFTERIGALKLLSREETPAEIQDFRPLLLRAKQKKVDAFFLCLNPGQSGLIAKQAREMHIESAFFGCETLNNAEEYRISGGALKEAWFATVAIEPSFRTLYRDKFNNEDWLSGAAVHYYLGHVLNVLAQKNLRGQSLIHALFNELDLPKSFPSVQFKKEGADTFLDIPLEIRTVDSIL